MLTKINFLISVYCSVSFHTLQFMLKITVFRTLCSLPCFWSFLLLSLWNGSRIRGTARLPQIMQCSQAKHRCVCVCVCVGLPGHLWGDPNWSPKKSNSKPRQALSAFWQTNPPELLPWLLDPKTHHSQHEHLKSYLHWFLKLCAGNGC